MRALVWAFAERIVPRVAGALVSLLLALLLSPEAVGLYSWTMVILLLIQSLTDVAARQVAMLHSGSEACGWFLRRYRRIAGTLGAGAMVLAVGVLAATHPDSRYAALAMAPTVLVPIMAAYELPALVSLQLSGRWREVARAQGVAATASLLVTVPMVVLSRSVLAAATQLALSEVLYATILTRAARKHGVLGVLTAVGEGLSHRELGREFVATSGYAFLGWGQSQADRAAIGSFAGTGTLGLYTIATSVGRSIGEAAALASSNVARAEIGVLGGAEPARLRRTLERSLSRSLGIVIVCVVGTLVGSRFVLVPLLGARWAPALAVVPTLAISVFPTLLAWNVSCVLQVRGRMHHAIGSRAVGLVMAIPIAFVAARSLQDAAALVVCRDVITALLMMWSAGRAAPWRAAGLCGIAMGVVGLGAWILGAV